MFIIFEEMNRSKWGRPWIPPFYAVWLSLQLSVWTDFLTSCSPTWAYSISFDSWGIERILSAFDADCSRTKKSSVYGVLLECKTVEYANSVYQAMNGAMYPIPNAYPCHLVFVNSIYYHVCTYKVLTSLELHQAFHRVQSHPRTRLPDARLVSAVAWSLLWSSWTAFLCYLFGAIRHWDFLSCHHMLYSCSTAPLHL